MSDATTSWETLFDLAMPALDHVFPALPAEGDADWTFGGGTALMLQIHHRISHDVDIFVHRAKLKAFTPGSNPAAKLISPRFQWPGHYLKFERQEGEIDFLSAGLQTDPGFAWREVRGRRVAVETPEEIVVKKIRFRSESFTARDAFDLAAVAETRPRLAAVLAAEVGDALPRLTEALRVLRARGWTNQLAAVVPTAECEALLPRALDVACDLVAQAAGLPTERSPLQPGEAAAARARPRGRPKRGSGWEM